MQENNKTMFLKRALACLMAVIMLVCAAPLGGFVGLDLGFSASAEEEDFTYVPNDDGRTAQITSYNGDGGEITFPSKLDGYLLTEIGIGAFQGFKSFTKINFSEGLISIGARAFPDCINLTEINFPKSLISIGAGAFKDCTSLAKINFSEGLTLIDDGAFDHCTSLTKIDFPESLTSIGSAFHDCTRLTEINLPENLTSIDGYTFSDCTNLTEINFPKSLTSIGEHAFEDCIRLTEIYLPESLILIYYGAFEDCTSLTDVYYAGTQEQWKKIKIDSDNDNLLNAKIHFPHTHSYKTETTKATFTKDGKTVTKCTGCGNITKTVPIKKVSTVKLSKTSYTYNGKVQKPSVIVKDSAGKALKSGTDYTVTYPSGMKNVGRYSVKITLKGKYTGTKTLTFDILPKATAKLTATQTTTSIKLTWSKVTGAKGYRVYKYDTKTKKYVKLADTTKTTYTINKLKAGTTYKYQVKAYGKSGNTTLWGAAKNISVTTPKIDVPKTLTATQTTTSIKLTWSKVTGAKGYRVYKYDTKTKKYVKVADTTKTTYTINKLKAGTTYKYQVKAYGKSGKTTLWSSAKSITTATKPATPKLTVKAGAKKATLSWKKITGATGYELYMATSKNGKYSKITTISKGATVKYTKSKLTKGKTYYFKMRTVKKVNGKNIYSAYSSVKSVKVK